MTNAYNVAIAEASKKQKRAAMPDPHIGKEITQKRNLLDFVFKLICCCKFLFF
jgi:hypothetical protein